MDWEKFFRRCCTLFRWQLFNIRANFNRIAYTLTMILIMIFLYMTILDAITLQILVFITLTLEEFHSPTYSTRATTLVKNTKCPPIWVVPTFQLWLARLYCIGFLICRFNIRSFSSCFVTNDSCNSLNTCFLFLCNPKKKKVSCNKCMHGWLQHYSSC